MPATSPPNWSKPNAWRGAALLVASWAGRGSLARGRLDSQAGEAASDPGSAWDRQRYDRTPVRLLPPDSLVRTGPVDHGDWSYRPVLGWLIRRRYHLIRRLLPARRVPRLLEIGYGSGIFLPELAECCDELHGIDVHSCSAEVMDKLRGQGVDATLVCGSAAELPYEDQSFDCLVALSSLEFIRDIGLAARELHRVLRPDGRLIFVTPASNLVLDGALRLLTGESARQDFEGRREGLLPTLEQHFIVERRNAFPTLVPSPLQLYRAYRMVRRPAMTSPAQSCPGDRCTT
jgi:SAM-dependent methyltransferase